MIKKKRKQLSPVVVGREKRLIRQFVSIYMHYDEGYPYGTPTWRMFESYGSWVKSIGETTVISVDGFGRLLPKHIKRKLLNRDGLVSNGAPFWRLSWP